MRTTPILGLWYGVFKYFKGRFNFRDILEHFLRESGSSSSYVYELTRSISYEKAIERSKSIAVDAEKVLRQILSQDVVRVNLEKGGTFKFKNLSSIFRTLGVNNAYQQERISGIRYLLPYFLELTPTPHPPGQNIKLAPPSPPTSLSIVVGYTRETCFYCHYNSVSKSV